ncbi:hypothetical protein [Pseudomonas sp. MN1F]|uniref:hypothetical protein n=1 Tax=Pseudomonas sp. MN1F TaxID=1366632 RepID=UPI00128F534E|nr:hypothetical protein [Pseudomonas sp. MN1F]MQG92067.1 hypothetical protein [Pseudomonas sp. MN1F]
MSDEKVVTPFEIGVLAAMQLLGKAVAMNPNLNIDEFRADADRLMAAMPKDPKWQGGDLGVHQAALDSLLRGIDKVQR